ncbi:MAG TPA: DUF192 domain-containing protein [Thermoanaerobaculia bacterium]|nr:DUF192 domain-containing protein [Thermoanaerobaculia bacterium]
MKVERLILASMMMIVMCSADRGQLPTGIGTGTTERRSMVTLPDGFEVTVEVVANDETRAQGLMFRESLALDRGMIFLFPAPAEHAFWMKNTLIKLDMIWLARDGTIRAIHSNAVPCQADPCRSYPPGVPADAVLELAGGQAQAHALAVGQKLRLAGIDWAQAR